jgi:hypothetical protein
MFVDNAAREIYGQLYLDGRDDELDDALESFADEVLAALRGIREEEAARARARGQAAPADGPTLDRMRRRIETMVESRSRP